MMLILAISIGWQEALPLKAPMVSIAPFFLPDLVHFQPVNKKFLKDCLIILSNRYLSQLITEI